MTPTVHTYFEDFGWSNSGVEQAVEHWAVSWRRAGFAPVVLSDATAREHPRFLEFSDLVEQLPTVNDRRYEAACFLRWAALDVAEGDLMVDFDVLNRSLTPERLQAALAGTDDVASVVALDRARIPCAVHIGSAAARTRLLADLFDTDRIASATIEIDGRPHVSDMTVFQRLEWTAQAVVCDSWTQRLPLMHFQTDISGGTLAAKVTLMAEELARLVAGDRD